jgi:hypothetical protein
MTADNVPAEAAPAFMVTEAMIDERDWGRSQVPVYRVSEVATVFFGMSESWLRLKLRDDKDHPATWFTTMDGRKMDFRRKDPGKSDSERVFLLSDIEPMAWSLYRFGAFERHGGARRIALILRVVEAEAFLYGLLDPSEPGEDPE